MYACVVSEQLVMCPRLNKVGAIISYEFKTGIDTYCTECHTKR